MKIILLRDLAKVGKKYQIKEVADSYARQVLLPQKSALPANKENCHWLEQQLTKKQNDDKRWHQQINQLLELVKNQQLKIAGKGTVAGKLFSGIQATQVCQELKRQWQIELPAEALVGFKPLRHFGQHTVNFKTNDGQGRLTIEVSETN